MARVLPHLTTELALRLRPIRTKSTIVADPHVFPDRDRPGGAVAAAVGAPAGDGAGTQVGAVCGAGHGYAFPTLNVLTMEQVAAVHRGRAVSWFTAMFDLGVTIANPILGAIADRAGYVTMYTVAGAGLVGAAIAVWWTAAADRGPRGTMVR